jgi:hypothetical protein
MLGWETGSEMAGSRVGMGTEMRREAGSERVRGKRWDGRNTDGQKGTVTGRVER